MSLALPRMTVVQRSAILALLALTLAITAAPTAPSAAGDLCDVTTGPPIGPTEPSIAGTISDAATSSGISGATVELYRCTNGTATYESETTTDSNGGYTLTPSLTPGWFFTLAVDEGPLANLAPVSGSAWNSTLLGVGPNQVGIDMDFE